MVGSVLLAMQKQFVHPLRDPELDVIVKLGAVVLTRDKNEWLESRKAQKPKGFLSRLLKIHVPSHFLLAAVVFLFALHDILCNLTLLLCVAGQNPVIAHCSSYGTESKGQYQFAQTVA